MATASSILYVAAGSPDMAGSIRSVCALCGESGTGILFKDWVKNTFMDFDKLKSGTIICHACQFCASDSSILLRDKLHRDKPQRMRNYSHLVVHGSWSAYHKGQKLEILDALRSVPAIACIALSGQKHILFRARPGWWQIEEQSVVPFPALLDQLLTHVQSLASGFSKTEVESGNYRQHRIQKYGLAAWKHDEDQIRPYRNSLPLQLAVWLAQKEEGNGGDLPDGVSNSRAAVAGNSGGLQGEVCVEHLEPVREQPAQRSLYDKP